MRVTIPEFCLVVLAGASGSGKSSFAREHFAAHRGHFPRTIAARS